VKYAEEANIEKQKWALVMILFIVNMNRKINIESRTTQSIYNYRGRYIQSEIEEVTKTEYKIIKVGCSIMSSHAKVLLPLQKFFLQLYGLLVEFSDWFYTDLVPYVEVVFQQIEVGHFQLAVLQPFSIAKYEIVGRIFLKHSAENLVVSVCLGLQDYV
jgi:hypothetical protein